MRDGSTDEGEAQMDVVQPGSARTKPIRPKAIRRTRMAVAGSARRLPLVRRYPLTWARASMDARARHADFEGVQAYVMFVGYPRSGHSLVGALLDAHPDAIVAHELDALKYVQAGFGRDQLFALLLRHQRARVAAGLASGSGYAYAVPTGWQGRYRQLRVIGDKKGGRSTQRLRDEPALLDQLDRTVGVPVKVIHVVRDPYDNIATMYRWAARPLEDQVDAYFELAGVAASVQARVDPDDFHELHTEDLVADPGATLTALAAFLGLPDWGPDLEAATSVVFPNPRRTRDAAPWTPELRRRVADLAAAHAALARYHGAG
jgi:hypothetical protein